MSFACNTFLAVLFIHHRYIDNIQQIYSRQIVAPWTTVCTTAYGEPTEASNIPSGDTNPHQATVVRYQPIFDSVHAPSPPLCIIDATNTDPSYPQSYTKEDPQRGAQAHYVPKITLFIYSPSLPNKPMVINLAPHTVRYTIKRSFWTWSSLLLDQRPGVRHNGMTSRINKTSG